MLSGRKSSVVGITICLIVAFAMTGCRTLGYRTLRLRQYSHIRVPAEDIVDLRMDVLLKKAYVRVTSRDGAMNRRMVFFVGPFAMNLMKIHGTIERLEEDGYKTVGTFNKGLKWGQSSFRVKVPKNTEIKLRLRAGGTKDDMVDVGSISIGSGPRQTVAINFTEAGVEIANTRP